MAKLTVTSPRISANQTIPAQYTCEGPDVSPALQWQGAPEGTKSLALICDDPDAPGGTWVHWVMFNIPATATSLPENVAKTESPGNGGGAKQGLNSFRKIGYGGPCPPPGHGSHRYFFRLFALDTELKLQPGVTKRQLEVALEGHVLARGELLGQYERK